MLILHSGEAGPNKPGRSRSKAPVSFPRKESPIAPFAGRSNTICQIDDIAIRLGGRHRWDPQKEMFVNNSEANRMLTKPMRSTWHL